MSKGLYLVLTKKRKGGEEKGMNWIGKENAVTSNQKWEMNGNVENEWVTSNEKWGMNG